jgi:hypothetical protein
MSKKISSEDFRSIIDLGLSTLGENGKTAIWFYLKSKGFSEQNASDNLPEFIDALRQIFGLGFSFLDQIFRQYLLTVLKIDSVQGSSFLECVDNYENSP